MYKLRLSPGADFDKVLEASSNAFKKIVEEGEDDSVRIYSYPSRDSVIAGAYIFKRLLALGLRPVVSVSVKPPPIISPTILLGYDSVNYRASEVSSTVLAVSSGPVRGTPVMNLYIVEAEGSCSAAISIISSEVVGYRGSWDILVALAGSYVGRYVERNGRFHGIDRILLEDISRIETYELEVVTTLKAYKPFEGEVCESIARTVNPYYPKMTGDSDYCRQVLRGEGLEDLSSRSLDSVRDRDELGRLVSVVLGHVGKYAKGLEGDDLVEEYVGGFPLSRSASAPISDIRMGADVLTLSLEVGGLEGLVSTVVDLEGEYSIAEAELESLAGGFGQVVEDAKPRRLKTIPKYRIYVVDAPQSTPLYHLWRALVLLGLVEKDSILAVEAGGRLRASPAQVEEAARGLGGVRRLVESKIASLEGASLWLDRDVLQR
ncbi:MAG: hypothetical protein F7B20_06860 [Aeropyrum sp.]|nr:hypothetical protein [Aeropyrum sp.]MCE4616077.1 hypothetical protein [Aeropyrum sp.]